MMSIKNELYELKAMIEDAKGCNSYRQVWENERQHNINDCFMNILEELLKESHDSGKD